MAGINRKIERNKKKNEKSKKSPPLWSELKDLNITLRDNLSTIMSKLTDINVMSKQHNQETEAYKEFLTVSKGVNESLKELIDKLNNLTNLHSTIEKNDKGDYYNFFAGEVDIEDQDSFDLYLNTFVAYSGYSEELRTFTNTSVISLMASFTESRLATEELSEKDKPVLEEKEDNGKEK